MFRAILLLLAMGLSGFPAWAAQTAPRVALVVGVSAYKHVPPLANTLNDAQGLAAALTRIGFEVETVTDPDRAALEAAVRRFGKRATGADAALFFYAGHALEFGGQNWLVPVQAEVHNERDLRFETVQIDAILEQIEGQARVSILVLDSCRDNPFRKTLTAGGRGMGSERGLAPQRATVGTLIVYATAPGTEAADGASSNSPFTTALLRHIETPGLEIRSMISEVRKDVRKATSGRQIPWDSSALEGEFFLKTAALVAPSPNQEVEVAFWNSVKDTKDAAELRAYLKSFPAGAFTGLARSRLARLTAPPPPAPAAPAGPLTGPLAPASPALPTISPPPSAVSAPPNGIEQIARVAEKLNATLAAFIRKDYAAAKGHKAIAVHPPTGRGFHWSGVDSAAHAERWALEGCQAQYASPCILLAVEDALQAPDPAAAPPRPMERVAYAGPFQVGMLPWRLEIEPEALAYPNLGGEKAIAVRPRGARLAVSSGKKTIVEAEREALTWCNQGQDALDPCFLYASGMKVILPARRTAAAR